MSHLLMSLASFATSRFKLDLLWFVENISIVYNQYGLWTNLNLGHHLVHVGYHSQACFGWDWGCISTDLNPSTETNYMECWHLCTSFKNMNIHLLSGRAVLFETMMEAGLKVRSEKFKAGVMLSPNVLPNILPNTLPQMGWSNFPLQHHSRSLAVGYTGLH
jgi:hypothetical protein